MSRFWGDINDGRLNEICSLIHIDNEDICIKQLPLQEEGEYGSLQLMLSDKPSDSCLEKLGEEYKVYLYNTISDDVDFNYLMVLETLRFAYDFRHHGMDGALSKLEVGNRNVSDGYYFVTDKLSEYRRVCIVPFKVFDDFGSGDNLFMDDALVFVKKIVRLLNDGEFDV